MRRPTLVAGEPELYCWCPVCQMPTRLRVPLHLGDTSTPAAAVLEICPGCGTGHNRPSVTVADTPRERRPYGPLIALARTVHRWACERRGRRALGCAHRDCHWPGLWRNQFEMTGDDGTWRYVFCTSRHRRAWAVDHRIRLT